MLGPMTPSMKQDVYETVLESIADGVFTIDNDFVITSFNHAAERITGFARDEAIGQKCFHVFRAGVCQTACYLRQTMNTGINFTRMEIPILARDNREKRISISTAALRDRRGQVIGGVETLRDLTDVIMLRREVKQRYRLDDLISKNHRMQEIFAVLPDVAASRATVLIQGETGTGKEVIAQAIHLHSPRKNGPFVKVNCAALPDTLLEAELFGHTAGAFTDAKKARVGRFAAADGGTIFLDEIGDISRAMQVKLLRVVQDRAFEPLGSSETVRADVRIVAATHRDLEESVRLGKFRSDLYYRLNVVSITLPPLRERREDIPLLVEHFLERYRALTGKPIRSVSPEVLAAFMRHEFPGNIRELEHAIEHAFVLAHSGTLDVEHLPGSFRNGGPAQAAASPSRTLKERERETVLAALRQTRFNKVDAARALGISRATLWRKMKRYGLPLREP
jgi:PAS domain S-box-containing protein